MFRYIRSLNGACMSLILHKAHYLLLRALETAGQHHSFGCSLSGLVWIGFLQGWWVRPCLKELVSLRVSVGTLLGFWAKAEELRRVKCLSIKGTHWRSPS